jgi:hypothetical protein
MSIVGISARWVSNLLSSSQTGRGWPLLLVAAATCGVGAIFVYSFSPGTGHLTRTLAAGLVLAGASGFVGALLGFLFGIPRSLQNDTQPSSNASNTDPKDKSPSRRERYQANTNLEQISDWLTKILVGVGLTQINQIPDLTKRFGSYFGPMLGGGTEGAGFGVSVLVYFASNGFLFSYLWTRLFLAGELSRADTEVIELLRQNRQEQADIDAKALSLATQILNPRTPIDQVPVQEMKDAITAASPAIRVQLFFAAEDLRSKSWRTAEDKPKLERVVPIFEALIDSDKEEVYHENYAQLGYCLRDKVNPDYKAALKDIDTAIRIRDRLGVSAHEQYELFRAACKILLDPDFAVGRPSSDVVRAEINRDLAKARSAFPDYRRDPTILKWIQLNPPE